MLLERRTLVFEVALTDSLMSTPAIGLGGQADGRIGIPTGSTITQLTFYDALAKDGQYLAAHDAAGDAVVLAVDDGQSYPLPEALVAAAWIKIVANAAGSIHVALKS